MRILLTEDNSALANLIKTHLSKFHVVDTALTLEKAYFFADTKTYDLLILDLVLPDGSGLEFCEYLKESKISLPILFLTAELDSAKKISCLQSGNEYLIKPFNILELEARVDILLRNNSLRESKCLENNSLELNQSAHQVKLNGKNIELNRKEFSLLELFLKYPTQVLSKAVMAEKIWQEEDVLLGNTIGTTIANLRRKLGKNKIKTIKGVGYSLGDV